MEKARATIAKNVLFYYIWLDGNMALVILFDIPHLPQNDWGRQINFKIYDERPPNNAFDCTFATGGAVLKTFDDLGNQLVPDINITWDTQNMGIGHFSFTKNSRPSKAPFDYYLCVQMWDSGQLQQTTTTRRRLVVTAQPSEF